MRQVLASLAFALTIASSAHAQPGDALQSTAWTIVAYAGDDGAVHRLADDLPSLTGRPMTARRLRASGYVSFSDGALSGSPACGGLVGRYAIDGYNIHIEAGSVLAGWCPAGWFERGAEVCAAMSAAAQFLVEGDHAYLFDATGRARIVLKRRR